MKAVVIIMGMLYSSPLMADVLCEKDSVSRTISVVYARPGLPLPCEVVYEKSETKEIETLWNAKNQAGYCETKAEQLIKMFEAIGWACKSLLPKIAE